MPQGGDRIRQAGSDRDADQLDERVLKLFKEFSVQFETGMRTKPGTSSFSGAKVFPYARPPGTGV